MESHEWPDFETKGSEMFNESKMAYQGKMQTLEEYGTNLIKLAEEGKLNPAIGRQPQIERLTQILGRGTKNNPCLVGEPGVGKTAIAEGLALQIVKGDVPKTMAGKIVFTLDVALLVAGTKYRGEFEERMKKLMEEVKHNEDCIGATTLDEYRKYIEKDPALERRFQRVEVPEPTVDETIEILKGLRERYEMHHKVRYTDEALVAAAKLSYQHISGRFLPDKAIDVIDEAGSRVRLCHAQLPEEARELYKERWQIMKEKNEAVRIQDSGKATTLRLREMDLTAQIEALVKKGEETKAGRDGGHVVTEVDVQQIVSQWTSIPVNKLSRDESDRLLRSKKKKSDRLLKMEETFH